MAAHKTAGHGAGMAKERLTMKVAYSRVMLFVSGLILLSLAILPAAATRAAAAPPLVITATSTGEPPTTTVPTTAVPTTPVGTTTVPTTPVGTTTVPTTPVGTTTVPTTPTGATATPTATAVVPTDEPNPEPEDTPRPTATATASPTPAPAPAADPAITKTASRTVVSVGDTVEFTLSVTNLGNATAADVVVEDTLPAFLALDGVSASRGEVSVSGATVRVVIGTIEPGETVTVRITARVVAQATPPDNANVGTVSTSSPGDNPANNTSRVELETQPAQATPTAAAPVSLPNTGDPGGPGGLALAALGLALIAASLFIRTRRA